MVPVDGERDDPGRGADVAVECQQRTDGDRGPTNPAAPTDPTVPPSGEGGVWWIWHDGPSRRWLQARPRPRLEHVDCPERLGISAQDTAWAPTYCRSIGPHDSSLRRPPRRRPSRR